MVAPHQQEAFRSPLTCLVGERLTLGPLDRDLLAIYLRWNNDFATTRTLAGSSPQTLDALVVDYQRLTDDQTSVSFTIRERATGRPIGNVAWTAIDRRNRTAEYVIIIGEADCRGKGYGTEATQLMLDYAFRDLGLHNVMLRVYAYNLAGYHAYRKVGFREYGRRRQCKLMGGQHWDVIYMECLASEYLSAQPPAHSTVGACN